MSQVFCKSGRSAPIAVLTLALTMLAASPARAQNLTIVGVTTEAVTGELLISGGPFATGVYWLRLTQAGRAMTKKTMVLR